MTNEKEAIEANVVDYEQIVLLTSELSKDTSIKKKKRKEIKELNLKLKN